jgi:hypothetical protein
MDERSAAALRWLLDSEEPAIRVLARRDVAGLPAADAPAAVLQGPAVRALLSGQRDDGGFGLDPYRKWTGAYWRLVSLTELGIPGHEPRIARTLDHVLRWRQRRRRRVPVVDGRARVCASIDGNVLAACCRLGFSADERAEAIAADLVTWQWPDGGWNCDPKAARRSSFYETLNTAGGLAAYADATGSQAAVEAADRAATLLLEHRLFRSLRTGDVINRSWLVPRYPPYWRYDILQALLVLSRMGRAADARAGDALDELESLRLADGRWEVTRCWWNPPGSTFTPDVVDWGRSGPNEMLTLNALRVLLAAGRL